MVEDGAGDFEIISQYSVWNGMEDKINPFPLNWKDGVDKKRLHELDFPFSEPDPFVDKFFHQY